MKNIYWYDYLLIFIVADMLSAGLVHLNLMLWISGVLFWISYEFVIKNRGKYNDDF
jgi:hypothetical protein